MKRRDFIAAGAALALVPMAAKAAPLEYKPGLVKKHLAKGETVFLDFKASWCGTCKAQERVINALKGENPAYDKNITFINVDWDEYGRSELAFDLEIPRRSTLVVLKGDAELGRIVADTSRESIKALMDAALDAATA
ncbi:thioredoxin family protein [Alisedimentitalea sp. MJ-SS2]|uniref:thioredoxin family protein n=1 Tax=Aliisedimentitalea sp. MJ-SS2 TaxID=3049795 RepID=UPI00290BBED8|nr:thioredoxin family protein [Alisedimentitalea sp. MJ-SS2]MDU8927711.1 thioredoxin family protein [Alisedimentitalea sp. MJ-SS2]